MVCLQFSLVFFGHFAAEDHGDLRPSLPSLSTNRQGLLHLPGLPQAFRKDLRTSYRRPFAPFRGDRILVEEKRAQLDRLYQRITDDLDVLLTAVGLKIAA
jgi:hypothetical protein